MQKYKEVPWWWYTILLILSFIAGKYYFALKVVVVESIPFTGLIVVTMGQTTLPWWSYIIALILGTFITVRRNLALVLPLIYTTLQPFSTILFARMGNGVETNQLMQMVAGAVNPGMPVANLYVSLRHLYPFFYFYLSFRLQVLDMESRCYSEICSSRYRFESWAVPQDPPSGHVLNPSLGGIAR